MFEINEKIEIDTDLKNDLCIIDNFYQDPDTIVDFFNKQDSPLHKGDEEGYNGALFEDRRFKGYSDSINPVYKLLSEIIGQEPSYIAVSTNEWRGIKKNLNDYENYYWWPHRDAGYTALVYLNKEDESNGTNLYEVIRDFTKGSGISEHKYPWQPKMNYRVIKKISPRYNRMVIFNGLCYHGMNICDDRYFNSEYRLNQVFFFKK